LLFDHVKRCGYCLLNLLTFEDLSNTIGDQLFNKFPICATF